MAGSKNDTHYSRGYNLYPTTLSEITIMQYKTDAVQSINVDGTPEGNEAANVGSIAYDRTNGNVYKKKTGTGNTGWEELASTVGMGDVVGSPPSTEHAIARYADTSGLLIENSLVLIDDIGVMSGATQINVDNLRLDGNTISSTDANGNIILAPDGNGNINLTLPASGNGIIAQDYARNGGPVRNRIQNTDGTGAAQSDALHSVQVADASIGDPYYAAIISGAHAFIWGIDQSAGNQYRLSYQAGTSNPDFASATNVMKIEPTGEINFPLQPAFAAYLDTTAANVTGNGTPYILGDTDVGVALTEIFDANGDFNPGSASGAIFTSPVTGHYQFNLAFLLQQTGIANSMDFGIVTSNRTWRAFNLIPSVVSGGGNMGFSNSALADMDVGDTCYGFVSLAGIGADTADVYGASGDSRTYFSGFLQG